MALFPVEEEALRQQEVWVLCGLFAAVDDEGRPDEALRWNAVDGVIRQVLARDPVDRCVEVRAGVLATGEVVPIPGRPALVVVRHLLDAERPALSHLRRQRERWKLRRQRLRLPRDLA